MVWDSDWLYFTELQVKADDAVLFDLLARWCPDEITRHKVLVNNPAELYNF